VLGLQDCLQKSPASHHDLLQYLRLPRQYLYLPWQAEDDVCAGRRSLQMSRVRSQGASRHLGRRVPMRRVLQEVQARTRASLSDPQVRHRLELGPKYRSTSSTGGAAFGFSDEAVDQPNQMLSDRLLVTQRGADLAGVAIG
jgi:hypothetical protein